MSAGPQHPPNLLKHPLQVSEKSHKPSAQCLAVEDSPWNQLQDPRMRAKPTGGVEVGGVMQADVVLAARKLSRRMTVHPTHRHTVRTWIIDGVEVWGRSDD